MPLKTRKTRRVDDNLVLTPLKQGRRKASVEVISDDKIPTVRSPTQARRPEKSRLRTKRVKTLVSEIYRIDLGNNYKREEVDLNLVDWKLFHGALFETAIIFFKGSNCEFESRIQLADVRNAKRVKLGGQVGLMIALRSSGHVVVLRFTRRSTRNGWYNQITKLRKTSVVSTKAAHMAISSDEIEPVTEFDEDLDDDVFEADETGDTLDTTNITTAWPRPRTASCPSQVCLRSNMVIDRSKPAFRSLRLSKNGASPVPKKKGLFKRLFKKATAKFSSK